MKKSILSLAIVCMAMPVFAQVIENKVLAPYRQGDRWGYSDTLGRVMIPPVYDSVSVLVDFGILYQKGKMGAVNAAGKILTPPRYDEVSDPYNYGVGLVVRQGHLRGFLTLDGKLAVPVLFEEVTLSEGDVLTVQLKNKFGLYNMAGRRLLPAEYDEMNIPLRDERLTPGMWTLAKKGKNYFIVNHKTGKLLPYKYIEEDNGPMAVADMDVAFDDSYGARLKAEDVKEQLGADQVEEFVFNNGYAWNDNNYFLVTKNGKQGLYDKRRKKLITTLEYDTILYVIRANAGAYLQKTFEFLVAVKKQGQAGLVTDRGEEVLPFIYDHIGPLKGNTNGFEIKKDGKVGVLLLYTSYPVISPKYEQIGFAASLPVNAGWNFSLYRVQYQGRTGYVGENGVEFFK